MRELVALFAAEPAKDGQSLGLQMEDCCRQAMLYLQEHTRAEVIFAEDAAGFAEVGLFAKLLRERFLAEGISKERLHIIAGCHHSTAGEIAGFELYCWRCDESIAVRVCATWYQVPRIWALWLLRHGRLIRPVPVWTLTPTILKRAVLEPAKMVFVFLPARFQAQLGSVMRRIGWI